MMSASTSTASSSESPASPSANETVATFSVFVRSDVARRARRVLLRRAVQSARRHLRRPQPQPARHRLDPQTMTPAGGRLRIEVDRAGRPRRCNGVGPVRGQPFRSVRLRHRRELRARSPTRRTPGKRLRRGRPRTVTIEAGRDRGDRRASRCATIVSARPARASDSRVAASGGRTAFARAPRILDDDGPRADDLDRRNAPRRGQWLPAGDAPPLRGFGLAGHRRLPDARTGPRSAPRSTTTRRKAPSPSRPAIIPPSPMSSCGPTPPGKRTRPSSSSSTTRSAPASAAATTASAPRSGSPITIRAAARARSTWSRRWWSRARGRRCSPSPSRRPSPSGRRCATPPSTARRRRERDFKKARGRLTFEAGQTEATVSVALKNDRQGGGRRDLRPRGHRPRRTSPATASPRSSTTTAARAFRSSGRNGSRRTATRSSPSVSRSSVNAATRRRPAEHRRHREGRQRRLRHARRHHRVRGERHLRDRPGLCPVGLRVSESDEHFYLALSDPVGGRFGAGDLAPRAIVWVLDDDPGSQKRALAVSDVRRVRVGAGRADFTISLSRPLEDDLVIRYKTQNGSARAKDFAGEKGKITVAAGATEAVVSVKLKDDRRDEGERDASSSSSPRSTATTSRTPGTTRWRPPRSSMTTGAAASRGTPTFCCSRSAAGQGHADAAGRRVERRPAGGAARRGPGASKSAQTVARSAARDRRSR